MSLEGDGMEKAFGEEIEGTGESKVWGVVEGGACVEKELRESAKRRWDVRNGETGKQIGVMLQGAVVEKLCGKMA